MPTLMSHHGVGHKGNVATLEVARRIQHEKRFIHRQTQFFAGCKTIEQITQPRCQYRLERPHRLSLHAYTVDDFVPLDVVNPWSAWC